MWEVSQNRRFRSDSACGEGLSRAFHDAVLELGSVPLPVLAARVDRFIAEGELPVVELSPRRVGALQSDIDAFKRARRVIRGRAA